MKKFISLFLIISVLVVSINTTSVYASVSDNQGDRIEQNIVHFTNGVLDGYSRMLRYAGIIIDSSIEASRANMQFIKDRLIALGLLSNGASDSDVEEFFDDNIIQNGKDVTFTADLNVYIKSEINEIKNNSGFYYAYSIDIVKTTGSFATGDLYNGIKNEIEANPNKIVCFQGLQAESFCYESVFDNSVGLVLTSNNTNYSRVQAYSRNNWAYSPYIYKEFNTTNKTFDKRVQTITGSTNPFWVSKNAIAGTYNQGELQAFSYNGSYLLKVYKTLSDFQSETVGASPYYITDSFNDYQSVSGSYNTTTDDHTVSYSDVVNFNNTYYGDNGNYPTAETIYQYINNNEGTDTPADNTPNDDPSGGGGSGGGDNGDDNGGSIFDWLSRIGALIGDLISGVGGFIAGILEGIVNALTTIFESITSIITNITSVIPNSLNSLMTSILGWLPEEWSAVLSAFLLVSLLVGLFKLFRG